MAKATVLRKAQFNAAHRLFRKEWTDAQNLEVFGPCSHPHYHGHNYQLWVILHGVIHEQTGYVYDLRKLKQLIEEEVMEPFDHRNLNLDTQEFRELNPTAENIARVIWGRLRKRIGPEFGLQVRLFETERNVVEYSGE